MRLLLIVTITSIFITTACNGENKKEGDFQKVEVQKPYIDKKLLPKNEQSLATKKEEDKLLNKIGIHTENDKIIIEPKKTKEFLENIAKSLEKEAKKLTQKAKDIKESNLGIETSKDKITIDINKTKSFLKSFSKELESISKEISKNIEIK